MELIGLFFAACGLLVLAGVAKALRPGDTARALALLLRDRVASLSLMRRAVRIGALTEASLGVAALFFPGPLTAVLVAASYALFVCVAAYARRHGGPLSTCGCFGRPDTPATSFHIFLNVVYLLAALAIVFDPPTTTSLSAFLAHQPWAGAPLLFVSGVGVWLSYLTLSPLAALEGARRLVQRAVTS